MALFGSLSFIPLYVEAVMGLGIRGTGSTLTLFLLVWVFFSFLSSRLMLRIGYRFLVVSGSVLLVLGFLRLTSLMGSATPGKLDLAVVLLGAGMGWIMAPLIVAVQSSLPRQHLGIATSSQVLFRTAGASIGVSLMGSVMVNRIQASLVQALPAIGDLALRQKVVEAFKNPGQLIDPVLRSNVPENVLAATKRTMDFSLHGVFIIALVGAVFALMAGFLVPRGKAEKHFFKENSQTNPTT